jgi:hypothetical protein
VTTVAAPAATSPPEAAASSPLDEITRDIARGGVAGLIVGVLVGGIGGRLFMRVAALLHPDALGFVTQNGNRVGDITLEGTVALVVFIGLFVGLGVGVVWVTVQTWIPGSGIGKALLTMPVAVALGSFGLLESPNPDFGLLHYDPAIVGLIVVFVALLGLSVALVDAWLDRRLPHADTAASSSAKAYAVVTVIGILFGATVIVPGFLRPDTVWLGVALIATGVATVAWWVERSRGRTRPSTWVRLAGHGSLLAAVVLGSLTAIADASEALGL